MEYRAIVRNGSGLMDGLFSGVWYLMYLYVFLSSYSRRSEGPCEVCKVEEGGD